MLRVYKEYYFWLYSSLSSFSLITSELSFFPSLSPLSLSFLFLSRTDEKNTFLLTMITIVVYVSPIEREKNKDEKKMAKKKGAPRKKTTTERQNKCTIVLIYSYGSRSSLQIFFFSLGFSFSTYRCLHSCKYMCK